MDLILFICNYVLIFLNILTFIWGHNPFIWNYATVLSPYLNSAECLKFQKTSMIAYLLNYLSYLNSASCQIGTKNLKAFICITVAKVKLGEKVKGCFLQSYITVS